MLRETALIISPIKGTGRPPDNGYRPQLWDDYKIDYADRSGQINQYFDQKRQPNLMMVVGYNIPAGLLDQIEENPEYFVVWREDE